MEATFRAPETRDAMFLTPRDDESPRITKRKSSSDSSCLTKIIDKIMDFFTWIFNLIKNCCCPKSKKNREYEFRQSEFNPRVHEEPRREFRIGRDDAPDISDRMSAAELSQYSRERVFQETQQPSSHSTHALSQRQLKIYSNMSNEATTRSSTAAEEDIDSRRGQVHRMTGSELRAYGLVPNYRAQPFAIEDRPLTRAEECESAGVTVEDYQPRESMLNDFMDAFGLSPEKIIGEEQVRAGQQFMDTRRDNDSTIFAYKLSDAQFVTLTKAPAIAYRLLTHLAKTDHSPGALTYCQETRNVNIRMGIELTDPSYVKNSFPKFFKLTLSQEGREEIQVMKNDLERSYVAAFRHIPKDEIEKEVRTLCNKYF